MSNNKQNEKKKNNNQEIKREEKEREWDTNFDMLCESCACMYYTVYSEASVVFGRRVPKQPMDLWIFFYTKHNLSQYNSILIVLITSRILLLKNSIFWIIRMIGVELYTSKKSRQSKQRSKWLIPFRWK